MNTSESTDDDCGNGNGNDAGSQPTNNTPACREVTVSVNDLANLTPEQVSSIEQQISDIFSTPGLAPGGVGVNFVDCVINNAPNQLTLRGGYSTQIPLVQPVSCPG